MPTELYVKNEKRGNWVRVPTEKSDWTWSQEGLIADAVMNALERVPSDLTKPMTGFKIKNLSEDEYKERWVKPLAKVNSDSSKVTLKVEYYEELAYYNMEEDLAPLTETVFEV